VSEYRAHCAVGGEADDFKRVVGGGGEALCGSGSVWPVSSRALRLARVADQPAPGELDVIE